MCNNELPFKADCFSLVNNGPYHPPPPSYECTAACRSTSLSVGCFGKRPMVTGDEPRQHSAGSCVSAVCLADTPIKSRIRIFFFLPSLQELPGWRLIAQTHTEHAHSGLVMCVRGPHIGLHTKVPFIQLWSHTTVSPCVTRYSIEKSSDPEKFFYIEITSGSLMTVRSLDREETGWHNITVLAMEMSKCFMCVWKGKLCFSTTNLE